MNNCGTNNWIWIIILLIIVIFGFGGANNGLFAGNGCGCNTCGGTCTNTYDTACGC